MIDLFGSPIYPLIVIPALHQVRDKLQQESSLILDARGHDIKK
jgi:hypothetical protein